MAFSGTSGSEDHKAPATLIYRAFPEARNITEPRVLRPWLPSTTAPQPGATVVLVGGSADAIPYYPVY